ncbi:ATP-binding cassette domain-containing protein [Labrys neptuniae]|uniref:ABC-F family ATP-binding cassette domain-containing protein n=1 Tax=Labrys neptuniae TaxID=376174 RepID=UPI00288D9298|nr:ATP-binding cassette domain-containing protein [Labrys neptuniae]MDT3376479.1 ATP-binding cassette domain-containing protein [Labrys neptuniae]
MAPPLLFLRDVQLTFGGTPTLEGADLSIAPGERLCLVGRNGSGKSTLLKIAAGLIEADRGERFVHPGATVRYLPQEPDLSGFATTLAYVEAGLGPGDDDYRALYLLNELGLTGEESPDNLSGGEARRTALARALAPEPDILLLDEPTNHLDLPAIEWLEKEIGSLRSALVLISHDRRFLENLSRATVWLDRGQTRRTDRGFAFFEEWRDQVLEEEERDRQKLDRKIVAEEHWVRYGVTARRKRNVRRMANLAALRQERRDARRVTGAVKLTMTEGEESGKLVVEAIGVNKNWGGPPIVKDFSIRIARGDRIGIVGPNGAGKTTLLNLLTGAIPPDSGVVKLGASLQMVTLDQRRESLDPQTTLSDTLTGGGSDYVEVGGERKHVIGYMRDFLFPPEQARTPVSVLSGGERGRLMLARALAKPSNFLVLDEPTNDLDLETLDLLQEMIGDYQGTVIVISHDRDFLDRVSTSILMSEGDGRWTEYAGGYSDMVAQRGGGVARKPAEKAETPKPAVADQTAAGSTPERSGKRKLSFKEKHALETLPGKIDQLAAKAASLQERLADPDLFAKDSKKFAELSQQLAKLEAEKAHAEEEWLALEMLREEIEG